MGFRKRDSTVAAGIGQEAGGRSEGCFQVTRGAQDTDSGLFGAHCLQSKAKAPHLRIPALWGSGPLLFLQPSVPDLLSLLCISTTLTSLQSLPYLHSFIPSPRHSTNDTSSREPSPFLSLYNCLLTPSSTGGHRSTTEEQDKACPAPHLSPHSLQPFS